MSSLLSPQSPLRPGMHRQWWAVLFGLPVWPSRLARGIRLLALICLLSLGTSASAAPLPGPLAEWEPWLLERHPTLSCPVIDGSATCLWPGSLDLTLDRAGGTFTLQVYTDRTLPVPLPGHPGAWPVSVRADNLAVPVLDQEGIPMVRLSAGAHTITGLFRWGGVPASLKVSPFVGRLSVRLEGKELERPSLGDDGTLRLSSGELTEREEDRLELEVARRLNDGIPAEVVTRVVLRAAGTPREVNLGKILLEKTRPVSLEADLPARLTEAGELLVQLRPGTFVVTVGALHEGALATITAPSLPEPWPKPEYWVFSADMQSRATQLSGPAGVDPARAPLPDDWKSLPTYMLNPGDVLTVSELRRGEPEPPPNRLELRRELWLDLDGGGLTFRDSFYGEMNQGWRLDLLPPSVLGSARDHGVDQVVTRSPVTPEASGLEVRSGQVDLVAESRLSGAARTLPAVGWNTEVSSLHIQLYLPPGWKLFAVGGVDTRSSAAMLDQWTLFDLFFVLIVALATARLGGRLWGGAALLTLCLTRHIEDVPEWGWVVLLICVALLRVAPVGRWKQLLNGMRALTVLTLLVTVADFSVEHLRSGIFPVLERPWQPAQNEGDILSSNAPENQAPRGIGDLESESYELMERKVSLYQVGNSPGAPPSEEKEARFAQKVLQQDPSAMIQTGPGIPTWSWNSLELRWSGPVTPEHSLELWLLGPLTNLLLAFLRVGLLVTLVLKLSVLDTALLGQFRQWLPGRTAAALGLLLGLLLDMGGHSLHAEEPAPTTPPTPAEDAGAAKLQGGPLPATLSLAHGEPFSADLNTMPALLNELEQKLLKAPECQPRCVAVPEMTLDVQGETLTLEAEVHAEASASWLVPGPARSWMPESVEVDGKVAFAMTRLPDGFLHVRMSPGVHRVRASGSLPPSGALTLQLGQVPQQLRWSGTGWTLDGLRADGTVESTVKLVREMTSTSTSPELMRSSENMAPWLEVRRTLELGIPWVAKTEVVRRGPADAPVSIKVPLLPGESVNVARFQVQGGQVLATLNRDESSVSWESTLQQAQQLELIAPTGVEWIEQWSVACSPIFACTASGVAPLKHQQQGRWNPLWRVWPGEKVSIQVLKPEGVAGQTLTLERVRLSLTLGTRLADGRLELAVRTSQGGQLPLVLPEGARLQKVQLNSGDLPVQMREGKLAIPLQPGRSSVWIEWQMPYAFSLWNEMPKVGLGSPAANVEVRVAIPEQRWVLGLMGPRWGPVPLFWSLVLIVLLAAPLLARLKVAPLGLRQWILLGLGLVAVPVPASAVVVLWFLALGYRQRVKFGTWWKIDAVQLGLAGLTLGAMGVLYAAIHLGLLSDAPSRISGNLSSNTQLNWYVDRVEGETFAPVILSLPLWVWRVTMLAWSLWMASNLIQWLPWAWKTATVEGVFVMPSKSSLWSWTRDPFTGSGSASASPMSASSASASGMSASGMSASGMLATNAAVGEAPEQSPSPDAGTPAAGAADGRTPAASTDPSAPSSDSGVTPS